MMGLIGRKGRTRTGDRWVGTLVGCLHHEPSKPLWGCRPTSPFARCSIDQNVGRTIYLCGFLVFGFVDVCFVDVCSLFDCLMFLWFFDGCYLLFGCFGVCHRWQGPHGDGSPARSPLHEAGLHAKVSDTGDSTTILTARRSMSWYSTITIDYISPCNQLEIGCTRIEVFHGPHNFVSVSVTLNNMFPGCFALHLFLLLKSSLSADVQLSLHTGLLKTLHGCCCKLFFQKQKMTQIASWWRCLITGVWSVMMQDRLNSGGGGQV